MSHFEVLSRLSGARVNRPPHRTQPRYRDEARPALYVPEVGYIPGRLVIGRRRAGRETALFEYHAIGPAALEAVGETFKLCPGHIGSRRKITFHCPAR